MLACFKFVLQNFGVKLFKLSTYKRASTVALFHKDGSA